MVIKALWVMFLLKKKIYIQFSPSMQTYAWGEFTALAMTSANS